ncbi:MAG: DUF4331 domain-containing protein [Chloroflexi bacterium]|nr:DUF4331 domain-containing protein [Chloroflexota bacterium]
MSSHREAPAISKDPVADSTDLYAFVSPDAPDTVTIIANYIPFEGPAGGPNFYEFGDDVLYEIKIDNDADTEAEIVYRFRFATSLPNTNTFLYNTGPIDSLDSPNWNRRQFYSVVRIVNGKATVLGQHLACPPVNIGPRSTPDYASLAAAAVHTLPGGIKVFAGQRRDGFFVDLGSIFDLGDLRPFQNLHLIPTMAAPGVDATKAANVHSIAIQVPKSQLTRDGMNPTNVANTRSVIGVWTSASRRKAQIRDRDTQTESGPWVQVSRLGNPLFNEVIVPMAHKDRWNSLQPSGDSEFSGYVAHPELAGLLPVLYPGVFPKLAAYTKPRADLEAILLTGIPSGVVPGFQNYTRSTQADMLRLNLAIPPSTSPNPIGLIAGDAAGFPNGRRVFDDTVAIELRAVAGATIPLVDPSFTPDGAAALLKDGTVPGSDRYTSEFPYLGVPLDGYDTPSS